MRETVRTVVPGLFKSAFRQMCATVCERFAPNEGGVVYLFLSYPVGTQCGQGIFPCTVVCFPRSHDKIHFIFCKRRHNSFTVAKHVINSNIIGQFSVGI